MRVGKRMRDERARNRKDLGILPVVQSRFKSSLFYRSRRQIGRQTCSFQSGKRKVGHASPGVMAVNLPNRGDVTLKKKKKKRKG